MKKLSLVSSRGDIENILRELTNLGCVEISEPPDLIDNQDLASCFAREMIALDQFGANLDNIELYGTRHALLLSGWIPVRYEADLASRLNDHLCAWALEEPANDEIINVPIDLCCPGIFGKLRRGGRKQFSPLARGSAL